MAELPPAAAKIEKKPLPALSSAPGQGAVITLCLELNAEWFFTLAGWLQVLEEDASWEGSVQDVSNSIDQVAAIQEQWSLGGGCVPTGAITFYAGASVPDGWLKCDGAQVEQADWPLLYDIVGDTFGAADPGKFRVPDLRGSASIGTGQGAGLTLRALGDYGGLEQVALSVSQMPSHAHSVHSHLPVMVVSPGEVAVDGVNPLPGNTGSKGSGSPHQNMPPYLALTAIIRGR